jgi:hypothetical protein
MLKNILNLKGAQQLSKKEQNTINGGGHNGCGYETESECINTGCGEPNACSYVHCAFNWYGWQCLPQGPGQN